jgi:hypothetical protein
VVDAVDVDADVDAFDCLVGETVGAAAVDLDADEAVEEVVDWVTL